MHQPFLQRIVSTIIIQFLEVFTLICMSAPSLCKSKVILSMQDLGLAWTPPKIMTTSFAERWDYFIKMVLYDSLIARLIRY